MRDRLILLIVASLGLGCIVAMFVLALGVNLVLATLGTFFGFFINLFTIG